MSIKDLLTDWLSFEKLVASICETGDVSVERDVILMGKSGVPRQIDVIIRSNHGLVKHLVLVECKFWNHRVERQHIDSFAMSVADLNASRGIMFTIEGYQEGAVAAAKHYGIELFRVRDVNASELLGPNTPISSYRHHVWRSMRNFQLPGIHSWERDLSKSTINIAIGDKETNNPTLNYGRFEGLLNSWSADAAKKLVYDSKVLLFDGAGGVRRFWRHIRHTADPHIEMKVDGAVAIIPVIEYDLGITLWQEHRELSNHDKGFMLAVEDCIYGLASMVSKISKDSPTIVKAKIEKEESDKPLNHPQIITIWPNWIAFDFKNMKRGEFYDTPGIPKFIKDIL